MFTLCGCRPVKVRRQRCLHCVDVDLLGLEDRDVYTVDADLTGLEDKDIYTVPTC